MKLNGMLARFCYVWLGYWLVFLIQPVKSIHREVELAWLLQFSFVFTVVVSFMVVGTKMASKHMVRNRPIMSFDSSMAQSIIITGYLISLAGLVSLVFDKVVIQGIDYTAGVGAAREQWRILGDERGGGMSSIYSAIGYLFGSSYYLSLAIVFSRKADFSDLKRFGFMVSGFLLLLSNSFITGGRSAILLAVIFVSYSYFTKGTFDNRKLFHRRKYHIALSIIVLVFFFYVLQVFDSRSTANKAYITDYSIGFLEFLGLAPYDWFVDFSGNSELGGFFALVNLTVSYLTHSFSTTAAIVEFRGESVGNVIFSTLMLLLIKFGLWDIPGTWFLDGRFTSLPGGLYYQYGILGMFIGGLALGAAGACVYCWSQRRPNSVLFFFYCSIIESIFLMSPFLFAGDLLFSPFLTLGGFISLACVRIAGRKI